jgi:hypothetical protein
MENKEEAKVGAKVRIKEPAIWNRPFMDPSNGFGADSAIETWIAPGSTNIRQKGIFRKKGQHTIAHEGKELKEEVYHNRGTGPKSNRSVASSEISRDGIC